MKGNGISFNVLNPDEMGWKEREGLGRKGMESTRTESEEMGWSRWNGIERDEMEWSRVGWTGMECRRIADLIGFHSLLSKSRFWKTPNDGIDKGAAMDMFKFTEFTFAYPDP
jgi:hypothetical protein